MEGAWPSRGAGVVGHVAALLGSRLLRDWVRFVGEMSTQFSGD